MTKYWPGIGDGMLTREFRMSVFLKSTWVTQTPVVPMEIPA